MPEEGEKFADVDLSWREVMAAAALDPAALPLGRDRTALESLQACNGLLDEIQKGLAAYLEKKRLYFPRCAATLLMHAADEPVQTCTCNVTQSSYYLQQRLAEHRNRVTFHDMKGTSYIS